METLTKEFMDGIKIVASNSDTSNTKRIIFFKRLASKLEKIYAIKNEPFKINLCDDTTNPEELDFNRLPEFLENLDIFLEKCILIPAYNYNNYILYLIKPSHLDEIIPNMSIKTLPKIIEDLGNNNKAKLQLV